MYLYLGRQILLKFSSAISSLGWFRSEALCLANKSLQDFSFQTSRFSDFQTFVVPQKVTERQKLDNFGPFWPLAVLGPKVSFGHFRSL